MAKVLDKGSLQAEDIAFAVGPRINAAGRMGQARLAVELLTTDDAERAVALAKYLDGLNKDRQSVERKILKQGERTRRRECGVGRSPRTGVVAS